MKKLVIVLVGLLAISGGFVSCTNVDTEVTVIELTTNGNTHEYIKYTERTGFGPKSNTMGITHNPDCKYCKH